MTLYQHDRGVLFRFEIVGELRGPLVAELEGCWATAQPTFGMRKVVVDVTGVTSWDESGRELLRRMEASGVEVIGDRDPGGTVKQPAERRSDAAFDQRLTRAAQ